MAKTAKVDKRKRTPPPRPKDTPSIMTLFTRAAKEDTKKPTHCEETIEQTDTRSFAQFPLEHPDVGRFLTFLQGLDGRKKSAREANQIAVDVSKFLKFADPPQLEPCGRPDQDPGISGHAITYGCLWGEWPAYQAGSTNSRHPLSQPGDCR